MPSNSSHLPLFEIGVAVAPLRPFVRRVRHAAAAITMDARFRHDVALLRGGGTRPMWWSRAGVCSAPTGAMVELLGDAADTVAFAPDVPVQVRAWADLGAGAALNVTRGVLAVLCRSLHVFRPSSDARRRRGRRAGEPWPWPWPTWTLTTRPMPTPAQSRAGAGTGAGTGASAEQGAARRRRRADKPSSAYPRGAGGQLRHVPRWTAGAGCCAAAPGVAGTGRQHRFEPVEYLVLRAVRILRRA